MKHVSNINLIETLFCDLHYLSLLVYIWQQPLLQTDVMLHLYYPIRSTGGHCSALLGQTIQIEKGVVQVQ